MLGQVNLGAPGVVARGCPAPGGVTWSTSARYKEFHHPSHAVDWPDIASDASWWVTRLRRSGNGPAWEIANHGLEQVVSGGEAVAQRSSLASRSPVAGACAFGHSRLAQSGELAVCCASGARSRLALPKLHVTHCRAGKVRSRGEPRLARPRGACGGQLRAFKPLRLPGSSG